MRTGPIMALGALAAGFSAGPAASQDFFGESWGYASEDQAITLRGGFGVIGIEAREHVFAGAGSPDNLSLLIWQTAAPMANVEVDVHLPEQWTVKARITAALFGDSYMEDYDWFGPDFVSYDFDDWTHRSQHPNTNLDWYLDASLAIGRDIVAEPGVRVNLNGGLKYTDVQWTAVGGSYIYSGFDGDPPGGFHADVGTLPDIPGITYRQQIPVVFAGLDAEVTDGQWTYEAGAQAGIALFARGDDRHWLRDLRFVDSINPAPMLGASATASYAFSDSLDLFVTGSVEKVFLSRGDTGYYDIPSGVYLGSSIDAAGLEIGTISLAGGLKGSF